VRFDAFGAARPTPVMTILLCFIAKVRFRKDVVKRGAMSKNWTCHESGPSRQLPS
jgi:hypothetical protein